MGFPFFLKSSRQADQEQAEEWFRKAVELGERTVLESPVMDAWIVLYGSHQNAGTLAYVREDSEESARHFDRMVEISREMAEKQRSPVTLRLYSIALADRALVHRLAGETAQALALCREENEIEEALFRETGTVESTMDYCTSEGNFGSLLLETGAAAEGKQRLDHAAHLAELAAQKRDSLLIRRKLGHSYLALCSWYYDHGTAREASGYAKKANRIFAELAKQNPDRMSRSDLSDSLAAMGNCARRRHRYLSYLLEICKADNLRFQLDAYEDPFSLPEQEQ